MLQSLQIRNYALVENLTVTFEMGLNAITGETGAGKSILIGALGMALGERTDRSQIRSGADTCSVTAVFELDKSALAFQTLEQAGVSCEEGLLVMRRVISTSGAGKAFVNDIPVSAGLLKQLGNALVDLHGPHEHQSLFQPAFQLALLDAFGKLDSEQAAYAAAYSALQKLEQQRLALAAGDPAALEREADMLRFQARELDSANLSVEEEQSIRAEHEILGHAQRIAELAQIVQAALTEGDTTAFSALAAIQQPLAELAGLAPQTEALRQEARALAARVQELSGSLNNILQRIESNPGRLEWLDERLGLIRKLCRKYGSDVASVLAFAEKAKKRLSEIESREEQLKIIESEIAKTNAAVLKAAVPLSRGRRNAAGRLAKAVSRELRALGFAQAGMDIAFQSVSPAQSGMDAVEFLFAPNPGEESSPLRAIASSGEISRVMLALKSVLADHDKMPVLIFDEIDVNIGGKTAHAVGAKLAALARGRQVLAITHLPQVAVHANHHLSVEKSTLGGRTTTSVSLIHGEERVEEIARMLGGRNLTSVSMRHAREMLDAPGESAK